MNDEEKLKWLRESIEFEEYLENGAFCFLLFYSIILFLFLYLNKYTHVIINTIMIGLGGLFTIILLSSLTYIILKKLKILKLLNEVKVKIVNKYYSWEDFK